MAICREPLVADAAALLLKALVTKEIAALVKPGVTLAREVIYYLCCCSTAVVAAVVDRHVRYFGQGSVSVRF